MRLRPSVSNQTEYSSAAQDSSSFAAQLRLVFAGAGIGLHAGLHKHPKNTSTLLDPFLS